ncbi:MAG: hypothetical protein ACLQOO_05375 [Terriglobia bacterium]
MPSLRLTQFAESPGQHRVEIAYEADGASAHYMITRGSCVCALPGRLSSWATEAT